MTKEDNKKFAELVKQRYKIEADILDIAKQVKQVQQVQENSGS